MESISSEQMIELVLTGVIVLIAGMVLWKLGALVSRAKRKPKRSSYFKNNMKDKYDRM